MDLTEKQKVWLEQHGGRDESSVIFAEDLRLYVNMFHPILQYERVYLPEEVVEL